MKITIEIDNRQKAVKLFLDFISSLPYVKKIEMEKQPNSDTIKAIQEAREGKTKKVNRKSNDVFEDILNS